MATLWIAGILPARGRSERRERQAEALRGGRPLRAAGIVGAAAVEGMARTAGPPVDVVCAHEDPLGKPVQPAL